MYSHCPNYLCYLCPHYPFPITCAPCLPVLHYFCYQYPCTYTLVLVPRLPVLPVSHYLCPCNPITYFPYYLYPHYLYSHYLFAHYPCYLCPHYPFSHCLAPCANPTCFPLPVLPVPPLPVRGRRQEETWAAQPRNQTTTKTKLFS